MEPVHELIEFAKSTHVGFWELVGGISVVVLALRFPELLRAGSEFLNERKRINHATRLKQDQARRRVAAAKEKREKEAQKK